MTQTEDFSVSERRNQSILVFTLAEMGNIVFLIYFLSEIIKKQKLFHNINNTSVSANLIFNKNTVFI